MTVYYVKQDNTVWGCGESGCCGEYYEEIDEMFYECSCKNVESDMAEHLQCCMGGGPVLKWRKAKKLEVQAFIDGKDDGYSEGFDKGVEWQKEKSKDLLHHHGFDFTLESKTATCKCGVVSTNPYWTKKEEK